MPYFDAMIAPVRAGRQDEYRAKCREMASLFTGYGALQVVDTLGDAEVPDGKRTDLWRAVAADRSGGESIGLGWIVWETKDVRDAAWAKIEADGAMQPPVDAPMDGKRMIFGGFDLINDSKTA